MKKLFSLHALFIISVIVSLTVLIFPVFSPTIRGTGDGFAHKFRAVSFIKSLREGNIRPRWLADHSLGYGTPTLLYNFSVPYYAVAGINVFVHSVEKSSQLYAAIIILLTFTSMYLFTRKLYGQKIGLLTAVAYIGAPTFVHSVYGWEAWGQMAAYMFPPLILYESLRIKERVTVKRSVMFVITWILFINTHNASAVLSVPPLVVIVLILMEKTIHRLLFISQLFLSACIISSFFWLPSIVLSNLIKYINLVAYHARIRPLVLTEIQEYIAMSVQTLTTGKTTFFSDTPGFLILTTIVVAFVLFCATLFQKIAQHKHTAQSGLLYAAALFLFTLISLLMTTGVSLPIWKTGLFDFILLYPSRFLFVITFTGTLLFGWVVHKITHTWILVALCALILVLARPFINLETTKFSFGDLYFEQNVQLLDFASGTWMNTGTEEFLPKWMNTNFIRQQQNMYFQTNKLPEKIELRSDQGTLLSEYIAPEHMRFHIRMKTDADVILNTSYYPNWTASINDKAVPVTYDANGRIRLHVPKGDSSLSVTFGYSAIERWSYVLSLLGLIYLFMLIRRIHN